jgi:putative ABC transport system permease protein
LITALFIKLLLAKDKREIAILKATGFTNQAIGKQYLSRSLITLFCGVGLGTLFAMTAGTAMSGFVSALLGGVTIQLTGSGLIYLGCPLLMLMVTTVTTKIVTAPAGKICLAENLKN